jgi:hypothetical protein
LSSAAITAHTDDDVTLLLAVPRLRT